MHGGVRLTHGSIEECAVMLFDVLGFEWDRAQADYALPHRSKDIVCFDFHKNMVEFVWDAAVLEGNPCTMPQVQTIMSGITVGGIRISDQDQVANLARSCKKLHSLVKEDAFQCDRTTFLMLHKILAREEALEWGVFRGEGEHTDYTPHVALGQYGSYKPLPTEAGANNLITVFEQGVAALHAHCPNPWERGIAFFLFGALQQFFFDGNKRTSRLMMNGIMMSHGLFALSIPATHAGAFNEKMVRFYQNRCATEMFAFLYDIMCDKDKMR
jgi:Fic family protein